MRFAPVAPAPGAHHILRVRTGGGGEISPESIKSQLLFSGKSTLSLKSEEENYESRESIRADSRDS